MKRVYDWKTIQAFYDAGRGFVECQRKFGFSHTAWIKAIKRGDIISRPGTGGRRARRGKRATYDWTEVQAYYDAGFSFTQCQQRFGFSALTWHRARLRGEITTRPAAMPLSKLLTGPRQRSHIKSRLLNAGILKNKCECCGIEDWQGRPLKMHIDHINGVKDDHRIENLRMLCPNCHSQTPTYGGRNVKR